MPNRIMREGWLTSPKVEKLNSDEERFFLRLCLKADDFGLYSANPIELKNTLFPLKDDVRATDSSRWLAACEKAGLVRCYETTKGRFLEILNFNQRTRAETSKYPRPPSDGQATDKGPPAAHVVVFGGVSEVGGANAREPVFVLKDRISEFYRRPLESRWSCLEDGLLAEIARRPGAIEEFELIKTYRGKMNPDGRKRFFPQSVRAFLEKWNDSIDKARALGIGVSKPKSQVPGTTKPKAELTDAQRERGAELMAKLKKEL